MAPLCPFDGYQMTTPLVGATLCQMGNHRTTDRSRRSACLDRPATRGSDSEHGRWDRGVALCWPSDRNRRPAMDPSGRRSQARIWRPRAGRPCGARSTPEGRTRRRETVAGTPSFSRNSRGASRTFVSRERFVSSRLPSALFTSVTTRLRLGLCQPKRSMEPRSPYPENVCSTIVVQFLT